jgi:hypothetical protein
MARNDLGVNILINTDDLKPDTTTGLSKKHVVIGRITYPQEGNLEAEDGWLVYVKPTITAGDRGEIRQYYETHKNWYPHPSTGDQWFDEWQFEAQRLLGEEAVNSALAEWIKVLNDEHNTFLSNVLELLLEESKPAQKISFNAAVDRTFEIIAQT